MHAIIQDLGYHQARVQDCQKGRGERYGTQGACFEEATPLCGSLGEPRSFPVSLMWEQWSNGVKGVM